ncbi:hypothetical protein E2C01_073126 [Portunus trituberculatus]|uniref:Uncharacterized protein n=1 Tax=Portunus trituberculatus TaxID=210409 RepID=A0A5B7I8L6_PORTR|nr:hypothetical protein [Portunus trituberculatus]
MQSHFPSPLQGLSRPTNQRRTFSLHQEGLEYRKVAWVGVGSTGTNLYLEIDVGGGGEKKHR